MYVRSVAPLVVLAAILAGCGPGSTSAVPSTSPAQSLAPSPATTPTSASTAAASASSAITLPHGAPDLEATLPDRVGTDQIFKFSFGPAELESNPAGPAIIGLITQAGGDPATVEMAIGNNVPTATMNVVALRGEGVDGSKLVAAYAAASIASGESTASSSEVIGGRNTTRLKSPVGNPLGDIWVYGSGDTLYGVQSKDPALVIDVLALLP